MQHKIRIIKNDKNTQLHDLSDEYFIFHYKL